MIKASDLPGYPFLQDEILSDYRLAYKSRQVSLIGRREVMAGKAKFGIFGDGKEVPQLAISREFMPGDFRSGYYRDQTIMFSLYGDEMIRQFFSQLYAHADVEVEPGTGGRGMDGHFATRSLNMDGSWINLVDMYNSTSDISPTAAQMPRLVGLGYASRLYREIEALHQYKQFSQNGKEVTFGTIGNASTAEGLFWEAINAVGVLQVPVVITIYDDEYGISVPNEYQMVKQCISDLLKGFQRSPGSRDGIDIYLVNGWDYLDCRRVYKKAVQIAREEFIPAVVHVVELTQPLGHSTSGSQERYKPQKRLDWEAEFDCVKKFREWILSQDLVTLEQLEQYEQHDLKRVEEIRLAAWLAYQQPILREREVLVSLIDRAALAPAKKDEITQVKERLLTISAPLRRDLLAAGQEVLLAVKKEVSPARQELTTWITNQEAVNAKRYDSHLYSQSGLSAVKVPEIKAVYTDTSPEIPGYEVLNACFDAALAGDARVIAFGEDVGALGDVNQGFHGLQAKYGSLRVTDTGIREATIIGQAIGLALRGLRPIAEIQYLDYIFYALQIMTDDLATLHWRTHGGQKAPIIIRTRGHRLEGIFHSGSLMSGIMNSVRGLTILVPRNMVQAAGFYNTLLRSDDPGLVVEVLNAYRIRERLPDNIGVFTVPVGIPEVIRTGTDITVVTYGACCRIVLEAAPLLSKMGIESEVIDVRSLMPFDLPGVIGESLKKTNRILFVDEDVPGGTSAYMLQEVIEKQGGYSWLDSPPKTLPGKPHRPAYGSDGDYFSKPNRETIFNAVYDIMHEVNPALFP